MPMKPKPNKHDRRSYRASQDGGSRREPAHTRDHIGQMPGTPQSNGATHHATGNSQGPNSGIRKTAVPKVFTPSDIEFSVVRALEPVLSARDGTVYSFSDWTLNGEGAVIVLPNGQEFWLTITEAK